MSNDLLPISGARQGQILDQLRAGPKTAAELARVLQPAWFKNEPETATQRLADTMEQLTEAGAVREIDGGRFEAVPTTADDAPEVLADNDDGNTDADPTGGPADNSDTETTNVATATAAPKKRGRKSNAEKAAAASNGSAPAAPAASPKQQPLGMKLSGAAHLEAISLVETELAEAKLAYEDALNVRRMASAGLGVARIERRRFGAHQGSAIPEIQAAQKKVRKAEQQFAKASANANELKNKVKGLEEKLSRAIEGERELFTSDAEKDGDNE